MFVGPERLELPVRDAADLQSAPMPSPVTTPKCGIKPEFHNRLNLFLDLSIGLV